MLSPYFYPYSETYFGRYFGLSGCPTSRVGTAYHNLVCCLWRCDRWSAVTVCPPERDVGPGRGSRAPGPADWDTSAPCPGTATSAACPEAAYLRAVLTWMSRERNPHVLLIVLLLPPCTPASVSSPLCPPASVSPLLGYRVHISAKGKGHTVLWRAGALTVHGAHKSPGVPTLLRSYLYGATLSFPPCSLPPPLLPPPPCLFLLLSLSLSPLPLGPSRTLVSVRKTETPRKVGGGLWAIGRGVRGDLPLRPHRKRGLCELPCTAPKLPRTGVEC